MNFRFRPFFSAEERLNRQQSDDFRSLKLRSLATESHGDVVREVRAGAVASEEAFGEIGSRWKEADGVGLMIEEPEDVESVIVLRRKSVFGRETVIDGENDGGDATSEAAAYGVVSESTVTE